MTRLSLIICLLIFLPLEPVRGEATAEQLLSIYQQLRKESEKVFQEPIVLRSTLEGDKVEAEVLSKLAFPFSQVGQMLSNPAEWCQFMPLNLNIKACLYSDAPGDKHIMLYLGRKRYQDAEDAFQLKYQFSIRESSHNHFSLIMKAQQGPMGTSNYFLRVDGFALDEHQTLLRIKLGYETSWLSRLATTGYLMTLGQGKIGFTVTEYVAGRPVYIQGEQGVTERNVIRYYFAVMAHLENDETALSDLYEQRMEWWFDATERYAAQLHEVERQEYLAIKRRERQQQKRLQNSYFP